MLKNIIRKTVKAEAMRASAFSFGFLRQGKHG